MIERFLIDVIWPVEYVISVFLAFIIFYFPMKKRRLSWLSLIIGFSVILGVWILRSFVFDEHGVYGAISYPIIYLLLFLTIYCSLDINLRQTLFLFTCSICLQHFSYKLSYAVYAFLYSNPHRALYYFISYFIIIALSDALFYFLFAKDLKTHAISTQSFITLLVSAIAVLTTFFVSYFTQHAIVSNLHGVDLALLQVYGIALPFVYVLVLFQNMIYQNAEHDKHILEIVSEKDKERYTFAKNTIDLINIKYHDLKHVLSTETLDEKEKEELDKTITNYDVLAFSGNRVLDIVLYEMKLKGEKVGVHVISIVDGSLLNFMQNNHLYTMFCNLLENAIESAEQLNEEDLKNVNLSISKARGSIVVLVENNFNGSVNFIDGLPKTTKGDERQHGFGLKSVKRIVESYSGILSVKANDGRFSVKIVFPV